MRPASTALQEHDEQLCITDSASKNKSASKIENKSAGDLPRPIHGSTWRTRPCGCRVTRLPRPPPRPDPLGRLGSGPFCLDGWDLRGPDHLDGWDLQDLDLNAHRPLFAGWILHLHVTGRGETLLLASSSFFSSSSRRARFFAGLARGEVSFTTSLEPPSLDDPSAFLLVPLSVNLLHQQKGH